ncbi:unnamed protein product [marine sediment metagenome]|uniref:Uncharacterized protein n=1 Tax=marine sediment metagenome TaxID=412755 RepID=X0YIU2_9ZZZZ
MIECLPECPHRHPSLEICQGVEVHSYQIPWCPAILILGLCPEGWR